MKSLFFGFLMDCWKKGFADEEKMQSYVPRYISEEECQEIIETTEVKE